MTADRPRVLLIEDEPEIRQFMRVSLHASDYVVQEAATTVKSTSRVTLFWALLSVILISSR